MYRSYTRYNLTPSRPETSRDAVIEPKEEETFRGRRRCGRRRHTHRASSRRCRYGPHRNRPHAHLTGMIHRNRHRISTRRGMRPCFAAPSDRETTRDQNAEIQPEVASEYSDNRSGPRIAKPAESAGRGWYDSKPWGNADDDGEIDGTFSWDDGVDDADEAELETVLHVVDVDMHLIENSQRHHTAEYDRAEEDARDLIVRRGQPFKVTITFDREFDQELDDLDLVFTIGWSPKPGTKTWNSFAVWETVDDQFPFRPSQWGAYVSSQNGVSVTIMIYPPPDCIVGEWVIGFVTILDQDGQEPVFFEYQHPDHVFILFNPWCEDDSVYMPITDDLNEYILNDVGCVFTGTSWQICSKPWNFGQFDEGILELALSLIREAFNYETDQKRADPIRVSRALSQMINSNDDDGVLVGRWNGQYDDGTVPSFWTGSADILRRYAMSRSPVKYGQCWVFSGVLTTVCRALGLPCRSVTNFESAHDTNASVTVDYYVDRSGKCTGPDSIWNFHVWNETWMSRPDLSFGYGGWQVIDATPQEVSDGVFCCGPCPVEAIRAGDMSVLYDAAFIFAEVNADIVYWEKNGPYEYKVCANNGRYTNRVGKNISTKTPNGGPLIGGRVDAYSSGGDREDVTLQYKYKEGSAMERAAFRRANLSVAKKPVDEPLTEAEKDVVFELKTIDGFKIGDDFDIPVLAHNTSGEDRVVDLTIRTTIVTYTGTKVGPCKKQHFENAAVPAGSKQEFVLHVEVSDYLEKLVEQACIHIYVMGKVKKSNQLFVTDAAFRLRRPDLIIQVPEYGTVSQPFDVTISFTNPLPKTLTNCQLMIEGPGIQKPIRQEEKDIYPKETWSTTLSLTPWKRGVRQVIASFDCPQLRDITGYSTLQVDN